MDLYYAIRRTLNSKPTFFPKEHKFQMESGFEGSDYYDSLYYYKKEHLDIYKEKKSIAGIENTITNRLFFDIDCSDDIEQARRNTLELCEKLIGEGVFRDDLSIAFSGSKGFHLELLLSEYITPTQFKDVMFNFAANIENIDTKVRDANRIVRLLNSKHEKSHLYKIPITFEELQNLDIAQIKELAKHPRSLKRTYKPFKLDKKWFVSVSEENTPDKEYSLDTPEHAEVLENINFKNKPKNWASCKWALKEGYELHANDRDDKCITVVATAKALGYSKEDARHFVNSACARAAQFYPDEKPRNFEDNERNIKQVYSSEWKGGMYSCKTTPWLKAICDSLGEHKCQAATVSNFIDLGAAFDEFREFATNIDEYTLRTGIEELDQKVRMCVGQIVGFLGAPSSGKTSLALEVLENTSRAGLLSVFYSLDMSKSELFQKIAQRVTGKTGDEIFALVHNEKEAEELKNVVQEAYTNVKFCFDTGVDAKTIEKSIEEFEQFHGKKIKLLMIDYNELMASEGHDSQEAIGRNVAELKRITNKYGFCTITLLQPPKSAGDAQEELVTYRNAKGNSLLEQCMSIMVTISRPGFSPNLDPEADKFMIMNVVKNRMGTLGKLRFHWTGLTGKIRKLTIPEEHAYAVFMASKEEEKPKNKKKNPGDFGRN